MIVLIQIDKSGSNLLEKNYSVVVAKNKKVAYGANISQRIKNELYDSMSELGFKKEERKRFIIRFHTAIIILLLLKSTNKDDDLSIEICNDFDGHFHELQNMVLDNLNNKNYNLKKEDIVKAKFTKPSFIDSAAKRFRTKKTHKEDIEIKITKEELKNLIKKR